MILSEADARGIVNKILGYSKAESCIVTLGGYDQRHIRFAQNMATTNGAPGSLSVGVESHFGLHSGSASTTDLSDDSLLKVVRASEKTAQLAPENPELMPPLGPQTYLKGSSYVAVTEATTSEQLSAAIAPVLQSAEEKSLQASGFIQVGTGFSSFATSKGLFAYDRATDVLHTVSMRTPDGTGSGWAGISQEDFSRLDAVGLGQVALEKCLLSQKPEPLPPGKYTVILEPAAACDLVGLMIGEFDQRSADEGRSFATKKGGGSRIGEQVFGSNVTIYSDPNDTIAPGGIYSEDGQPATHAVWVDKGVLKILPCNRYWAQKNKIAPVPSPNCLTMQGGTTSTPDLIKQVSRGLLITRFWYIRMVDPQTVVLTGLTRDGVFLIENGKIARPVCNFRFNESPVAMLNRVAAMGPTVRAHGEEMGDFSISVPPMLIDGFTLSSVSDAV